MPKQTIDVLMGGYLSKDAAHEDFDAVQACGAPLDGARRHRARASMGPRDRAT